MTIPTSSFKVERKNARTRIDALLVSFFSHLYSRGYFQVLIAKGSVFVNGKSVQKDYRVREGDEVSVRLLAPEAISLLPDPAVPFAVVYDGDDFAVIDKPAGVTVHPSVTCKKGTLVNGLLARWPCIKRVGEDSMRPGIVHRLDKETSGLMVIPKTQPMFLWLKKQFKEGLVTKRYLALVTGKLLKKEGEITAPIGRLGMKQVVVSAAHHKGLSGKAYKSRFASTGFKVSAFYDGFTLVHAYPKTGRMHQIRVHFKHLGHPVAGDKKYASRARQKLLPLARHFLHAEYLAFFLPDGKKAEFLSPLPNELRNVLKILSPPKSDFGGFVYS